MKNKIQLSLILCALLIYTSLECFVSYTLLVKNDQHVVILGEMTSLAGFTRTVQEQHESIIAKFESQTKPIKFIFSSTSSDKINQKKHSVKYESRYASDHICTIWSNLYNLSRALFQLKDKHALDALISKIKKGVPSYTIKEYFKELEATQNLLGHYCGVHHALSQELKDLIPKLKNIFSSFDESSVLLDAILTKIQSNQDFDQEIRCLLELKNYIERTLVIAHIASVFAPDYNICEKSEQQISEVLLPLLRDIRSLTHAIQEYIQEPTKTVYIINDLIREDAVAFLCNSGFSIVAHQTIHKKNDIPYRNHKITSLYFDLNYSQDNQILEIDKNLFFNPMMHVLDVFLALPTEYELKQIHALFDNLRKLDAQTLAPMRESINQAIKAHSLKANA